MELETEKKEKVEAVENLEKLKLDERRRENELSGVKEQLVSVCSLGLSSHIFIVKPSMYSI